jgi:hypothetical protein
MMDRSHNSLPDDKCESCFWIDRNECDNCSQYQNCPKYCYDMSICSKCKGHKLYKKDQFK